MTNYRKLLLAGTAVVALGATPAFAQESPIEIDTVNNGILDGTDSSNDTNNQIIDNDNGNDDLELEVEEEDYTFGLGDETDENDDVAGIDATGDGSADPSSITFVNDDETDDDDFSFTVTENEDNDAVLRNNSALTITLGDADDASDQNAITANIDGNVNAYDDGVINFDINARGDDDDADDNNYVLNLARDVDLGTNGDTVGTITLDDDSGDSDAIVNFVGNAEGNSQEVTGLILSGDDNDEGTVNVLNAAGVTFNNAIGVAATTDTDGNPVAALSVDSVNVGATGPASGDTDIATGGSATFMSTVNANDINIGSDDAAGDATTTATFEDDVVGVDGPDLNDGIVVTGGSTAANTAMATFNGNVGGPITLDEDTTDAEDIGEASVVFGGDSQTIDSTIDGESEGEGSVNVADDANVTFNSDIGGSTSVGAFDTVASSTVNLANDVIVTSAADGDLDLNGTTNIDLSDDSVEIDDEGNFAVGIDGTINVTQDEIGDDNVFLLSGGTETDDTDADGVDDFEGLHAGWGGSGTLNVGGDVQLEESLYVGNSDGDRYAININNSETYNPFDDGDDDDAPVVFNSGNVVFGGSSTLAVNVNGLEDAQFDGTTQYTLIDGEDGTTVALANDSNTEIVNADYSYNEAEDDGRLELGTAFVNLDLADDSDEDLIVTASLNDAEDVFGSDGRYNGAANAALGSSAGGTLAAARANLINSGDADEAEDVAESLSPSIDNSISAAAIDVVNSSTSGLTGDRLASLRDGEQTGMAAGNLTHGLQMWGQVFGMTGEQDDRDGISGFDVDSVGGTVGVDTSTIADGWVWGLAFSYANTDTESDGVNQTESDIDSYQLALYADYAWSTQTYINGQVGYGLNQIDQTRNNVGLTGASANADFDADLWFASLEAGQDFDLDNGLTLTPIAQLNFSYLDTDEYTEDGADTANLEVDMDERYRLEAGLGLEASTLHQLSDGSFLKPRLRASYRYDFLDDRIEATSSFEGAPGVTFETEGFDPQQHTFDVGGGLTFYSTSNVDLTANYNYEIKEDYDAHSGYVRATYNF